MLDDLKHTQWKETKKKIYIYYPLRKKELLNFDNRMEITSNRKRTKNGEEGARRVSTKTKKKNGEERVG